MVLGLMLGCWVGWVVRSGGLVGWLGRVVGWVLDCWGVGVLGGWVLCGGVLGWVAGAVRW